MKGIYRGELGLPDKPTTMKEAIKIALCMLEFLMIKLMEDIQIMRAWNMISFTESITCRLKLCYRYYHLNYLMEEVKANILY